ncbi:HTH DNA binding domain-containing protein [Paracoccus halophilus]|uniref:HTH DNA binding domain-containing protein n=1 Tax=Paracoccus halophilus TaxID=376733 RepID=A0A099EV87_9RHOB|nr:helix-turn-helix domain-containing protein [Paracoccus halophilus]KGJ01828.1 hypothetical protein IT41_19180 [Paracoccus halophilus]SFA62588.1 HTH DNA binding domain-containing protein [Paracoccus halophilus]
MDDDFAPDPLAMPLPRADRRDLLDPAAWLRAEADQAAALARAAMALGRLDGALATLAEAPRAGALARLAMEESGAMLWAAGTPLAPGDLGRELLDAPARVDPEVLRRGRWAVRRLQGRGGTEDLRDFLGLQRVEAPGAADMMRPTGLAFDAAADEFAARLAPLRAASPITRAGFGLALWRLCDLSPAGELVEPACWAARIMAAGCRVLQFAPLGHQGRAVWGLGGAPLERLGRWYAAVGQGADAAQQELQRLLAWQARAHAATARIKGDNPARIIAALTARPMMSTAMVAAAAEISRDTAERLLARMDGIGLIREFTGAKRFRLWAARL